MSSRTEGSDMGEFATCTDDVRPDAQPQQPVEPAAVAHEICPSGE
jgi:hypothetical protein